MKVLIVGAAYQGKTNYAVQTYSPDKNSLIPALHEQVAELLAEGRDAKAELLAQLDARKDWVVVCDEVGCGIVPVDADMRHWREEVGRLCCELALRAEIVERISCGLALRLKGEVK